MDTQSEELLNTLKALADESRLRLLRLVNQQEHTVGELAALVNLSEPTVSHHLSRLRKEHLVTLRMAGNQRYYHINMKGLAHFKRQIEAIEHFPPQVEPVISDDGWIDELGWNEENSKILRNHTENGKLVRLPGKQKRLLVILRWLATLFEADRLYTEAEVNEVIKTVHTEDYVSLRRDLVDMGYLRRERDGGKYWLTPDDDAPISK